MSNINYLAQLNAARAANEPQGQPSLDKAMSGIKQYSEALSGVSAEDVKEINDLMDKVDGLSDIFTKYAKLQSKMDALKENAAILKVSMKDLNEVAEEANIDALEGYTQEQTYAIGVQVMHEFKNETRLSKDLLKLSETQVLEEEIPDEVPAYDGLTKEQTVQVYMQVISEFENKTELAKRLAYNAGVE